MNNLREPSVIISLITATGLLGFVVYSVKKTNRLTEELRVAEGHISSIANVVAEVKGQVLNFSVEKVVGELNKLNEVVQEQKKTITSLRRNLADMTNNYDNLQFTLDNLVKDALEQGRKIDTVKPAPRRNKTILPPRNAKKSRRAVEESSSEESSSSEEESSEESSSEEDTPPPRPKKKTGKSQKPDKSTKKSSKKKPAKSDKKPKAKKPDSDADSDSESDDIASLAAKIDGAKR